VTEASENRYRLQKPIADVDYVLFNNDTHLIYCDTSTFTLADQRVYEGVEKEQIAGEQSDDALTKILQNRNNTPVGVYPHPSDDDISSEQTYRVAISPMFTWELN